MSLYHFHVTQIGRSKGHSAVAAAAYRSCTTDGECKVRVLI